MITVQPAPDDFLADVHRARAGERRGDLSLFAYECRALPWADAGLRAVQEAQQALGPAPGSGFSRTLVFTGHMVDAPGRPAPRFPRTTRAEDEARRLIRDALLTEIAGDPGPLLGFAGGASGGDILFHEVAGELGIPTQMLLALPPDPFIAGSVEPAGGDWIGRFRCLLARLPTRILSDTADLPAWVRADGYDIWQRNNLWILFTALAAGAPRLTLIALWDAGRGDGPGGTDDLVARVERQGHKVVRLPAERLKALA